MKVCVFEHQGCFAVELSAETIEDAAVLVRLGMNCTSDLRCVATYVDKTDINTSVVIGKRKVPSSRIVKVK